MAHQKLKVTHEKRLLRQLSQASNRFPRQAQDNRRETSQIRSCFFSQGAGARGLHQCDYFPGVGGFAQSDTEDLWYLK
jgi:hypothetical protein